MTSVEKINLGAEGHENRRRISYEVKRQLQVPSYQLIPEMEFGKELEFLARWWEREASNRRVPQIFLARQERLL